MSSRRLLPKSKFLSVIDSMKFITSIIVFVCAVILATSAFAEVVYVDQVESGFFVSSKPTQTIYWQGKDSKALIVFIPGGDGQMSLDPYRDPKYFFYKMLKSLSDSSQVFGHYDVVLMNSPFRLTPLQPYPSARASKDHLIRIHSVIEYYRNKTNLPIWLMGHSNGGISLTEYINYIQNNEKSIGFSGVIASGIRNQSNFKAPIDFPMLFIHHEKDGCQISQARDSFNIYKKVSEFNKSSTEFALVTLGREESASPCYSGYHMYYDSGNEAPQLIDSFISKYHH